jgi:hypothetical protein
LDIGGDSIQFGFGKRRIKYSPLQGDGTAAFSRNDAVRKRGKEQWESGLEAAERRLEQAAFAHFLVDDTSAA